MIFKIGPIENLCSVLLNVINFFLFGALFCIFCSVDFSWMVIVVVSILSEYLEDVL